AHGTGGRATADQGPGGAQKAPGRLSALRGRAAVLCVSVLSDGHQFLAAVREELLPQPHLRLRQSRHRRVAGAVEEEGASGRRGEGARDTLTRSHWFLSRSPTPPLSLSLLSAQPHVLKSSVHPVAGHRLIVADACRAHLETRVPQTRDPPGFL